MNASPSLARVCDAQVDDDRDEAWGVAQQQGSFGGLRNGWKEMARD